MVPACARMVTAGRSHATLFVYEKVTWLAVERLAKCLQRGESDCSCFVGLEDREISQRNSNGLTQL